MKTFYGFVKKEFWHIFRDFRTLIILFGMPVAQILLFGFVITNEVKDADIAVLDNSKSELSKQLVNKILSSGYFHLNEPLPNEKAIEDAFKRGTVKEVIVIPHDFEDAFLKEGKTAVQVITDASDPNTANILFNYTQGIIQNFTREKSGAGVMPAIQIVPEVRMYYNQQLRGVFMFVPGTIALILMLISAMMTSISITREKELGTMEVLLVSPLKPWQVIIGKVIPYLALSFLNALIIIILGYFVFGVPVRGSLVLLLAESLLYIFLALSLGILISTISNSQQMAMFISMFALMLPTILLSGFIYPIENMPLPLQWLSVIMPPKYFISIIKDIMVKGVGFEFVWQETLILIGMVTVFVALSIKKYNIRLE